MQETAGEEKTNWQATFSYETLHVDEHVLDDYEGINYNSSVWTQNAV